MKFNWFIKFSNIKYNTRLWRRKLYTELILFLSLESPKISIIEFPNIKYELSKIVNGTSMLKKY